MIAGCQHAVGAADQGVRGEPSVQPVRQPICRANPRDQVGVQVLWLLGLEVLSTH